MSAPDLDVDLVSVNGEAHTLRSALESFNIHVATHWIATAEDIVRVLGGDRAISDYLLIDAHGRDGVLCLPELGDTVEKEQPYHKVMAPADFEEFMQVRGRTVINTSCSLGTSDWGDAFLRAGCSAYIGAAGYPEGSAALFYAITFFYNHVCRGLSVREAHGAAASHDEETEMYQIYQQKD